VQTDLVRICLSSDASNIEKTKLAGTVRHELNCVAIENDDTKRILAERTIQAMKPKAGTIFMPGEATRDGHFIQPGTVLAQGAFGGFIVCLLEEMTRMRLTSTEKHWHRQRKNITRDQDRPNA